MSKYDPLYKFLAAGDGREVALTFDQVKILVSDIAPAHATDDRWWANDDATHVQSRAWSDAGYTAHPDRKNGRVSFRPASE